jgi:hypothetical protein
MPATRAIARQAPVTTATSAASTREEGIVFVSMAPTIPPTRARGVCSSTELGYLASEIATRGDP